MRLNWKSEEVQNDVAQASAKAVNRVMAKCIFSAKNNHDGWVNRSGIAEGSIRVRRAARRVGDVVLGLWGSINVVYFRRLEYGYGRALQRAAERYYPDTPEFLRRYLQ